MSDEKIMEKLNAIHSDVSVVKAKMEQQNKDIDDHESRLRTVESSRWKIIGGWASLTIILVWAKIKEMFNL
ncbi:hypothetical protein [Nocardia mangyaensis]|uniref:hypothetical protein n=1 Tax=Nocardia mangyaensis TaxID=2213200 RepID=UPI0026774863|nr:hypothetical protein [Nocardia mangyaensis]MDO3651366.1 hypothetical protein [Nocardia mangyaensis]